MENLKTGLKMTERVDQIVSVLIVWCIDVWMDRWIG